MNLRESYFERWWTVKGVARVQYQRLNKKEKDIRKRKRKGEQVRKGGVEEVSKGWGQKARKGERGEDIRVF